MASFFFQDQEQFDLFDSKLLGEILTFLGVNPIKHFSLCKVIFTTWGQCYKTFYGRKLQLLIAS